MDKVYILNKIFDGSWNDIEGNISHEIIDFVLTDSGKYFVYNVPYGTCPDWISVNGDTSYPDGSHEAEYLLLTTETHNKTFNILYRIKLIRKVHNFRYTRKWPEDARKNEVMRSIYEENQMYYGGSIISDLIDNYTPLVTFQAEYIEMPAEPIDITLSEYRYQRNKGYIKSDMSSEDYRTIEERLNDSRWIRVDLDTLDIREEHHYSSKTFLDLILKNKSEECYTNMLYSVLNESGMLRRFCRRFAPKKTLDDSNQFTVFREHSRIKGRMDICADNGYQRIVIENKLGSGLNGVNKADSSTQLTKYYDWTGEVESSPICFITAPDYRIFSSHSKSSPGQLAREIRTYDPLMLDKYILISYGEICDFLEENREAIPENYEYYRYLDDIIAAFRRHSYPTKGEYYRSLLQESIYDKGFCFLNDDVSLCNDS